MYGAQHVYLGHCDICFFEWKSSLYKLLLEICLLKLHEEVYVLVSIKSKKKKQQKTR